MHRRRKIGTDTGLKPPAPQQRDRGHQRDSCDDVNGRQPDPLRRLSPDDAANGQARELHGCEHRHSRPRTQPGRANWADTFKVAIAATQEMPANTRATKAVTGSRAMANRTSASAVPTVAPATTRSAPSRAAVGKANAPQTAPAPIAPRSMP